MKYTLVFDCPEGQEPVVNCGDNGDECSVCAVSAGDVFDELRALYQFANLCNQSDHMLPKHLQKALANVRTLEARKNNQDARP
jgi:hypothetical protein